MLFPPCCEGTRRHSLHNNACRVRYPAALVRVLILACAASYKRAVWDDPREPGSASGEPAVRPTEDKDSTEAQRQQQGQGKGRRRGLADGDLIGHRAVLHSQSGGAMACIRGGPTDGQTAPPRAAAPSHKRKGCGASFVGSAGESVQRRSRGGCQVAPLEEGARCGCRGGGTAVIRS